MKSYVITRFESTVFNHSSEIPDFVFTSRKKGMDMLDRIKRWFYENKLFVELTEEDKERHKNYYLVDDYCEYEFGRKQERIRSIKVLDRANQKRAIIYSLYEKEVNPVFNY
jgi:hypothetical protein